MAENDRKVTSSMVFAEANSLSPRQTAVSRAAKMDHIARSSN
jgi:hypothetical protein